MGARYQYPENQKRDFSHLDAPPAQQPYCNGMARPTLISDPTSTSNDRANTQPALPATVLTAPREKSPAWVDWRFFQLLLLIWAPAALAGIYTKSAMLRWDGYLKTALALGFSSAMKQSSSLFTLPQKLSFFRADLLLSVVAVPAILLLVSRWRSRFLIWLVALASIAWIAVLAVQLEAFRMIGSFQSLALMKDGLRWGLENGRQAKTYILGVAVFRATLLIAAVLAAAVLASFRRVPRVWQPVLKGALVLWIVLLGVTELAWLPWMPRTASHSSVHLASLAALPDSSAASSLGSLSRHQLQQKYRQLTHAPEPSSAAAHWASARDYDVLFFVLETTPERCVDLNGSIEDLPNIGELRRQAWVANSHYSTYPITSRALFSILTSMYPSDSSKDTVRFRDRVNTGLIPSLNSAGYETAVYGSSASIVPWAKDLFENLAFKHIRSSDDGPGSHSWDQLGIKGADPYADQQSYVVSQQKLDLRALADMKADLSKWIDRDQRYAALYLPQLSHAPWGDALRGGKETNLVARCRGLAEIQDQWLGDILTLLQQRGRLSKTLIVVTGDHGIRTSIEDPTLAVGVSDEYSFRVPFLLYAPGIVNATENLPWLTSHLDIEPSVLGLLGISRNTDNEEGGLLWDPRLAGRTTYFLSSLFSGADGYYSNGKFYSWNRSLDITYQNDKLQFGSKNVVPLTNRSHDEIAGQIRALDDLRSAWMRASSR